MRALIRKAFRHGAVEMIPGTVAEIDDAAFAEHKRERRVTHAPPEEPAAEKTAASPSPRRTLRAPR